MHATFDSVRPVTGFSRATNPLVSVIISYYKQEGFIAEKVKSVKQQMYPDLEIIVDDGSPAPAVSVLQDRHCPPRISGCPSTRTTVIGPLNF
jgi:cellulose synthase/poly-beta-1,6-N-acetylglucosamine synthase-like glycosyltransferase